MTIVFREIFSVAEYKDVIEAAQTLKAKRVVVRAGGTWREVKASGRGELCFGPFPIRKVTSRGTVHALVDGKLTKLIPYTPTLLPTDTPSTRPEWWITFEIEF